MNNPKYKFRAITENDYEYIYQVKKDAFQKYVEMNFGKWDKVVNIQYFKQNPVGKLYERLGFKTSGETAYHYQMVSSKQK